MLRPLLQVARRRSPFFHRLTGSGSRMKGRLMETQSAHPSFTTRPASGNSPPHRAKAHCGDESGTLHPPYPGDRMEM